MHSDDQRKVVVIGLDCLEPTLVFEKFRGQLPNLERLMEHGMCGKLRSCDPPITVPAWSSMMSSKDPGTLGIYGFRNRADHSYDKLNFATGATVREPRLWDHLGRAGKRVILLGVPQSYPPRPVNGMLVGCFLTPSIESDYTYPKELKNEIARLVGPYMVDVPDFRTEDKDRLRDDIYRMTEKRFTLARHFLRAKPWDFFMMVEMGTDRVHHGFWKYMDPAHPKHEPGNPNEHVIRDYYRFVDAQVGELLEEVPEEAVVLVVSDHGAKCMEGGICINEWLIEQGYLVLRGDYPAQPTRFADLQIDWERTRAWGDGGYYGRIFLNVQGREPEGIIPVSEYEAFRNRLAREIEAIPLEGRGTRGEGREGNGFSYSSHAPRPSTLRTRALKPEELYRRVEGVAPDLIVYFGDLSWRSVGTVGLRTIHTLDNDTGPDDANHAQDGLFILAGQAIPAGTHWHRGQIMDIAPTVLELFGIDIPEDMQGKCLPIQVPAESWH